MKGERGEDKGVYMYIDWKAEIEMYDAMIEDFESESGDECQVFAAMEGYERVCEM